MGAQTACSLGRCCETNHRQNHMKTVAHPPYILELAPAYIFLFLEVKNEAGCQDPDPGHLQKQLGWGHQEAEQRRLHHHLGEAQRSLEKVHLTRGKLYAEKLIYTLVSILFSFFATDTFRVKLKHTTYICTG